MTLRFVDSFDHYATADITSKWTAISSTGLSINSSNGRRSTQSMRFNVGASQVWAQKTIDAQATWIVGFAFKTNTLVANMDLIALYDGSTQHVTLRTDAAGHLIVTRAGTTLGTSTNNISINTTYYIELKSTINDTTGSYDVHVNGASWLSGSGADTRNGGNSTADNIRVGAMTSTSCTVDIDDMYVCDSAGSTNNDFLGDVRVDAYYPSGAGNSTQLTASSGSNYTCVDEALQNGDTDYVQSATAAQKDTYAFADMSHTPTNIYGVQINAWAKKDDAGARSIATVTRSGGADTDGSTIALGTTYADFMTIRETDPNTGLAWTKTNFNAAEFGVKVAA